MPTGEMLTIDGDSYYTERRTGQHQYEPTQTGMSEARTWDYTIVVQSEAELAHLIFTQLSGAVAVTLPSTQSATCAVIIAETPMWVSHYCRVKVSLIEVLS